MNIREQALNALVNKYKAQIEVHKVNIEVYLTNSVGVAEHTDIMSSIEHELDCIATLSDRVSVIEKEIPR